MTDLIYDEHDEAKIAVSQALWQVAERHRDLDAAIGHGIQRILARQGERDPSSKRFDVSLEIGQAHANPSYPKYDKARVMYVNGFLEMKAQLRADLTRYFLDQVRDNALALNQDHEAAVRVAQDVLRMAGSGIQHLNEQREANRQKRANYLAERERKELAAARRRAKDRHIRTG